MKKGDTGINVRRLQKLLSDKGYEVATSGTFDTLTYDAVRAFQSSNVDADGLPLKVDGIAGPLTLSALSRSSKPSKAAFPLGIDFPAMPDASLGGTTTGRNGLRSAIGELRAGAGEIGGNNRGKWVRKYLNNLAPEGSPWCAGFVSWCLSDGNPGNTPIAYSLGARAILAECKKMGFIVNDSPLPGDLVVWWRGSKTGWEGHIGFVHQLKDGKLYTIEGNKSAFVQGFSYTFATMEKLLGFCRLQP